MFIVASTCGQISWDLAMRVLDLLIYHCGMLATIRLIHSKGMFHLEDGTSRGLSSMNQI